MINNGRFQSRPVTGYYEYLSTHRQRVDVAPQEKRNDGDGDSLTTKSLIADNDENSSTPVTTVVEENEKQMTQNETTDVTKWSSVNVLQWIDEQCEKFELKKTTKENFQMNGQALILLTKHDFLRRAPDGGEILYYALQKMINPKKSTRSSTRSPKIIEMNSDDEELSQSLGASLNVNPIVEEPDDLPSTTKTNVNETSRNQRQQNYPYAFAYRTVHMRPPVFAVPNNTYYQPHYHHHHQHGVYPQTYVYGHQPQYFHHHHHQHQHQHPQTSFLHQYYPMMSAQGIMIEAIDNETLSNVNENGANLSMNENSSEPQEQLYLVTMNGQRQVMTEDQIRQLVADIHQQQQMFQNQSTTQENLFFSP